MLDRILLSRVFQSWTYQRLTASTLSRISVVLALSYRSRSYVIVFACELLHLGPDWTCARKSVRARAGCG